MFDLDLDLVTDFTVALLVHYSFDLGGQTARELTNHWLKDYPATWVCQGVIEALYQGRYKAVSVEQILAYWQRRGQAMHHYNYEFERIVCNGFPPPASANAIANDRNQQPRWGDNYCPIQQFTPPHDNSEFYTKLKAISQSNQDDPES